MTSLDLVLAGVILASALFGLFRGFISALASLLAWLLAGWAAFHYGAAVAVLLAEGGTPEATELFGGYALCFIVVMIVVGLIGWAVKMLVKAVGLSSLDRLLGLALGAIRGVFIAVVMVVLMAFTALPRGPGWQQAQLLPVLIPGAQWLSRWLPEWTVQELDFGNGPQAGDNTDLLALPPPLDDPGAPPAPVRDESN
ncbi:MAG TPA: CvpA family protein [Pseudoxanthomonas sp.]|jgi:membrane protein required for colicin V production|nr:CvpA family protein [Pseudoxanthomonas sp.]